MKGLEKFQKRVVQWITVSKVSCYISQLRWLSLLPLPMFRQLNYFLLLVKLSIESNQLQLQKNENLGMRTETFKLPFTRADRSEGEYTLRTCRCINNPYELMGFSVTTGLKEWILAIMWKLVNSGFCENDFCSLMICDCGNCRNTRKKFWFSCGRESLRRCRKCSTTTACQNQEASLDFSQGSTPTELHRSHFSIDTPILGLTVEVTRM